MMLSRLLPSFSKHAARNVGRLNRAATSIHGNCYDHKNSNYNSIGHSKRFYNDAFHSDDLEITLTDKPKTKSAYDSLQFGKEFTDHMLEINWTYEEGWQRPQILPYHKFSLDPASSVFHYGLEAFEGLKAYRDHKDHIRLFRPAKNWERLNHSCEAMAFPTVYSDEFEKCVEKLLSIDRDWIPNVDGYSLYLRPTIISTYPFLGVGASKEVKLYVICSPVGPYYKSGFAAISLLASDRYVRAWPQGSGKYKIGANYAPTIRAQQEAALEGYSQCLWLFPMYDEKLGCIRHRIEEAGTMNMFVFMKNVDTGCEELITPPLSEGTILPGVTRDSVLTLCREYDEFNVIERELYMDELVLAYKEGRILEAFGSGTAAIISPLDGIGYKGEHINIPLDPNNPDQHAGPLAKRVWNDIVDIQYGRCDPHPWSVIVKE